MKFRLVAAVALFIATRAVAQFNTCGDTNVPGGYVTHATTPSLTDSRITGKNSGQFAFLSTNTPLRNQLVVFFPGTGGVPVSFDNFCQNAANLGFHALSLTYDNDVSLQTLCGNEPDPVCFYNARYETLTGENTATNISIGRTNCIEFRLAAFLNWLNTNYPAENWGQFLIATNSTWTNALAWNKFLLCGHSQGGGFAAFAAKFHEVQRVASFVLGDFSQPNGNAPAPWIFLPPVTPADRWFNCTHYYDVETSQTPAWEALGLLAFAPIADVGSTSPPYNYSHALTSLRETCTNVAGNIDYHGAIANDFQQKRDTNGVPFYATAWTHMLIGPTTPPMPAGLIADSVRDFSSTQNSNHWTYGFWNRTLDGGGGFQVNEFRSFPTFSNTLYAIPAWIVTNSLQAAIWASGARPHGVNTNACCTNFPSGPELWPIRRWVSPVSGPVHITGSLAKWDFTGADGLTGNIATNGTMLWSASLTSTNIFGTNFNLAVNLATGTVVDFFVSPGPSTNADGDSARFSAQIVIQPPTLAITQLSSTQFAVSSFLYSGLQYQFQQSTTLTNWSDLGSAINGSNAVSSVTNSFNPSNRFFRLEAALLP